MKLLPFFLPFLLWQFNLPGDGNFVPSFLPVEICDNGIDDDNDGLIDLNDEEDCKCQLAIPESLIPNPSFEEYTCCPQDRSQLYCAKTWIQASEPTTDYLHTCGWMGWPDLPPPVPFPDGNGCVGFRNGRVGTSGGPAGPQEDNPNWKEYAGACLLSPLKAGISYRFEFWVGFTQAFNSPPTTITFYGSTDCSFLPFGVGDERFGCPLNGPGWIELGHLPIEGAFEWKQKEINVTPLVDIYAMAIGPNCAQDNIYTNTYYFFDNLVLADVKQFEFKIQAKGNPCKGGFTLELPNYDTLTYQWYKNGIALVGETAPTLTNIEAGSEYQVRVVGPNSCKVTQIYKHKIPFYETRLDSLICEDESIYFNESILTESGEYVDTLQSYQGCDSIVHLKLQKPSDLKDTVYVKIFEDEKYRLGDKILDTPGEYDAVFTARNGCDSLIHLVLDFYKIFIPNALSPNGDGINDVFTVFAGKDVQEIHSMEVFDRWGNKTFSKYHLPPNEASQGWDGTYRGKPASTGVYTWLATLTLSDGRKHRLAGSLTILR